MVTRIVCLAVALLAAPTGAQGGKEIKSKDALAALEKYGKQYADISKEFKLRHQDLLKALIADLNPARAAAIGNGDLDEALAISLKVKEAEKLQEQDQFVALKMPGEKLVAKDVAGRRFQFIAIDVEPAQFVLGEKGQILDYKNPNEAGWQIDKYGRLCLLTKSGGVSSAFDQVRSQPGKMFIDGNFLLRRGVKVFMREVPK